MQIQRSRLAPHSVRQSARTAETLRGYKQHVVLPVHFPDPSLPPDTKVHKAYSVHSIATHLLYHNDDPLDVIEKYVKPHALAGDILAVAETPLAIMQGRYRHPVSKQGLPPP